jgi:hypothetical protein
MNRTRRNIDAALKVKIALGAEIERLHAKAGQLLQRNFLEVRDGLTKDSMKCSNGNTQLNSSRSSRLDAIKTSVSK